MLLSCAVCFAFEFLYEKEGVYYYKTDDGHIISKAMQKRRSGLVLIHQERDGKRKYYQAPDEKIVVGEVVGGVLSNTPDYDWWYGCAPTAAGMIMGYYDTHGYQDLFYNNLVPGGTAEPSTFGGGPYIANDTIASQAHIEDYYVAYGETGDPAAGGHSDNCLADFMETSKDSADNSDGATTFYYYQSGTRFKPKTIEDLGLENKSGMYGIKEWVEHNGYTYETLYNRYIDSVANDTGITFADFKAEIDAGRPAILHLEGHSMVAYGYTEPDTVYVHDTGSAGEHTMTWGGPIVLELTASPIGP